MSTKLKNRSKTIDIVITALALMLSVGMTVLLRDILFPITLVYHPLQLACLTLSK